MWLKGLYMVLGLSFNPIFFGVAPKKVPVGKNCLAGSLPEERSNSYIFTIKNNV